MVKLCRKITRLGLYCIRQLCANEGICSCEVGKKMTSNFLSSVYSKQSNNRSGQLSQDHFFTFQSTQENFEYQISAVIIRVQTAEAPLKAELKGVANW
jgi:hypothetical protein